MREQAVFDSVSYYMNQAGKINLFSPAEEIDEFKKFEAAAARLMSELESHPETRRIVRDLPRSFSSASNEEIKKRLGEDSLSSRDSEITTRSRINAFLEQIEDLDRSIEEASDEDALILAQRTKYFGLHDSIIGKSFLFEAIEHPAASEARRFKARMERIRNKIMEANLRLVLHTAKKYTYSRMSTMDLVQEGNFGLVRAIERFDWRKGFKFSTYSIWWIRQSITRAIADKDTEVRIPVHQHEMLRRISKESRLFETQHGRTPDFSELESTKGMSPEKLAFLQGINKPAVELDAPRGKDEDSDSLVNFLIDNSAPSPDALSIDRDVSNHIRRALCRLSPKEQEILTLRFGLRGEDPMTLENIGEVFKVTRERVRQIEKVALKKLSASPKNTHLRDVLTD